MANNEEYVSCARDLMSAFHKFKSLHNLWGSGLKMSNSDIFMLGSIDRLYRCGKGNGQGIKISELSRIHHISKPAISQSIRSLEQRGYVRRSPGEEDRRVVYVCITPKGEKAAQAATQQFMDELARVVREMGLEETHDLTDKINRLYDIISQHHAKEKSL